MRLNFILILFFIAILFPKIVFATNVLDLDQIAYSKTWLKLLHYRTLDSTSDDFSSEITSKEFFLSENGSTNPLSELKATLIAFNQAVIADEVDNHARCRFPAREILLNDVLNSQLNLSPIKCSKWVEWSRENYAESISLVFATGYLDNPASYFGHLLMKFNSGDSSQEVNLLDHSLNYGAIVPEEDNVFKYMFNGIFGGYPASFSDQNFFRHNHSYGETELRDLWEYQLNLTQSEVDLVVAHTWELLPVQFEYYFLTENCGYRMAKVLELVLDEPLVNSSDVFIMPYEIFDSISQIKKNSQPFVTGYRYIPSRQKKFINKYDQLSNEQKSVINLFDNNASSETILEKANQFTDYEKAQIYETAIEYILFSRTFKEDPTLFKDNHDFALLERIKLPAKLTNWNDIDSKPPHTDNRPSMIRVGYESIYGVTFNFRANYYDLLSSSNSRKKDAKLIVFQSDFRSRNDEIELYQLDFLDVMSLNASSTGLSNDGGLAWQFNWRYAGISDLCNINCRSHILKLAVGKGFNFQQVTVYGLLGAQSHASKQGSGNYSYLAELGLLAELSDSWKLHFNALHKEYSDLSTFNGEVYKVEGRYGNYIDWDIRFSLEKEIDRTAQISLGYYF